ERGKVGHEVDLIEGRFGVASREVGQQVRGYQHADAATDRPGRTHLLATNDQACAARGNEIALQAGEIVIAEGADDELPAAERDLIVATGANRSEVAT